MPVHDPSRYPLKVTAAQRRRTTTYIQAAVLICAIGICGTFLLPQVITLQVRHQESQSSDLILPGSAVAIASFPVSVDPATKSIKDNPLADKLFTTDTTLTASTGEVFDIVSWLSSLIENTRLYQSLAAVDGHLIVILPGYRKEEVVQELATDLNWDASEQQAFLTAVAADNPGLSDGMFAPGNYVVDDTMTPSNIAALFQLQFTKTILLHYSTTTASQVPLAEALTVASLIEREASGPSDMRIISGIIWNRLFDNMNLQIDATLQYAKGENSNGDWWTDVVPKDKYIASAYNTYLHPGLPPGPIASPSVAAVLAALNPVQTSCLYYFHDSKGQFHCSDTYEEHVTLLKQYYGQGK